MRKILFSLFVTISCVAYIAAQTDIYVSDFAGDDTQDGTSWATAYETIDAALDQVSSNPGTYVIKVAQGKYIFEDNDAILDALPGLNGDPDEYKLYGNAIDITIEGGYRTPVNGVSNHDPLAFTSAFDTQTGTRSAFRILSGASASLKFKDITLINARQGSNANGALLTFDSSIDSKLEMENLRINEWIGGNTEAGRGLIYVYNAQNTIINVNNSLVQRTENDGKGQFVRANAGNSNLDINVQHSVFRNLRKGGTNVSLFQLQLDCSNDQGTSSLIIEHSKFFNNKRGLVTGQAPGAIKVQGLPLLKLTDNVFQGNTGGAGAVLNFQDSGELISKGNTYQDNFGGYAGIIFIHGSYGGAGCSTTGVSNDIRFEDDKFFSNRAGVDGVNGRGAAIMIANTETGTQGTSTVAKKLTITNSAFTDNHTRSASGGALFINNSFDVTITGSTFCDNEANRYFPGNSSGSGGAINARGTGKLIITNSTFRNNKAYLSGGAIYSLKDELIVNGCSEFENNTSRDRGGAISGNSDAYNISETYFFQNSTQNSSGGALSLNSGNGSNTSLVIDQSRFIENTANDNGGAFRGDGYPVTITNSLFQENSVNGNGGAIWNNQNTTLENVNFISNKAPTTGARGYGGAILIEGIHQHEFLNTNFENNEAGNAGGAIRAYSSTQSSNTSLVILNSNFVSNKARGNGGAIATQNYGLITDTAQDPNFVLFKDNQTTGGSGGAIYLSSGNSATIGANNFNLSNAKYINNESVTGSGGALYLDVGRRHNVSINSNEFLSNNAFLKGGAVAIEDYGAIGAEVDVMVNNNFYTNTVNGDATIVDDKKKRSDIWLETTSSGNYTAKIENFSDNQLQFPATVNNYPTRNNTNSDGYNLVEQSSGNGPGSGNSQSNGITFNYIEKTIDVNACPTKECVPPPAIPVSPIILSANKNNSNNPDDYTTFTQVGVDQNCNIENSEVAFTARANTVAKEDSNGDEYILVDPIPELEFTYTIEKANNLTGEKTVIPGNVINRSVIDAIVQADPTDSSRVEETSAETPNQGGSGGARDIYRTYFLDVQDELEDGFTYTYEITQIKVIPDQSVSNPDPVETYDYEPELYNTTILTDFCICATKPNMDTTNIKSTQVGISTLDRNTQEWLAADNEMGAYIVLESSNKGFIVPRFDNETDIKNNIGTDGTTGLDEGMIVWDNQANCLKMFFDKNNDGVKTWNCVSNDNCQENF